MMDRKATKISLMGACTFIGIYIYFSTIPIINVSPFKLFQQNTIFIGAVILWVAFRPIIALIYHIALSLRDDSEDHNREYPSLSIIIPAYNEEDIIRNTIESLTNQNYPSEIEIIIVDDGSTDSTWSILQSMANEFAALKVFTQPNQGAGTAQNFALNKASMDTILKVDADTYIPSGSVKQIVKPLKNPKVAAVGGNVEVLNHKDTIWTRLQSFEYLLAMEVGRMFQTPLRHLMCISGAFGAFRKEALEEAGGWVADPRYGEDFDLTIRLHSEGKLVFNPDAVALTDVPETITSLAAQRFRWRLNGLRTMLRNRQIFFNTGYGAAGTVGLPVKLLLSGLSFVRRVLLISAILFGISAFLSGAARLLIVTPFIIASPFLISFALLIPFFVYTLPLKYVFLYPIFLGLYRPVQGIIQLGGTIYFIYDLIYVRKIEPLIESNTE